MRLFYGRISRKSFLIGEFVVVPVLGIIGLYTYENSVIFQKQCDWLLYLSCWGNVILIALLVIVVLIFDFSLRIRRSHDINENYSRMWWELPLFFRQSYKKSNKYGTVPPQGVDILNILGFR